MPQSEVSKSGSHNVEQSPTRPVLGLDLLRSIHLTLEKLSTGFLLPWGKAVAASVAMLGWDNGNRKKTNKKCRGPAWVRLTCSMEGV